MRKSLAVLLALVLMLTAALPALAHAEDACCVQCTDKNHDHLCDACGCSFCEDADADHRCDSCDAVCTDVTAVYTAMSYRNDNGLLVADGTMYITVSSPARRAAAPAGTVKVTWTSPTAEPEWPEEIFRMERTVVLNNGLSRFSFTGVPADALEDAVLTYKPDKGFVGASAVIALSAQADAHQLHITAPGTYTVNGAAENDLYFLAGTPITVALDRMPGLVIRPLFDSYRGVKPDELSTVGKTVKFIMPDDFVDMNIVTCGVYDVWVGGRRVTEANLTDVLGDGTVSFDPDTQHLTLRNANITSYARGNGAHVGIHSTTSDLHIQLIGNNVIDMSGAAAAADRSVAIHTSGNLVFHGTGTLTIKAGPATSTSLAAYADGTLDVATPASVTAIAGPAAQSYGLFAKSAMNITGTVHACADQGETTGIALFVKNGRMNIHGLKTGVTRQYWNGSVQNSSVLIDGVPADCVFVGNASPDCPSIPFEDVPFGAPYHEAIDFVLQSGLMNGVSADRFAPNEGLSRAMLVTMLWRAEGAPDVAHRNTFSDVPDGRWYSDSILWAYGKGLVQGYGKGLFGPTQELTREQLAAILWRYAQVKGMDVSVGEDTNILSYTDAGEISSWAFAPLQWACGAGVFDTAGSDQLRPDDVALRAETAQMLMQLLAPKK